MSAALTDHLPAPPRPARAWGPGLIAGVLLFPSAVLLIVFLVVPLCATVWLSLSPNVLIDFDGHGLGNYTYLVGKTYYATVLVRTLRIAAEVTAVSLLVGYPAALVMRGLSAGLAGALAMAMTLPVLSGPLVVVLGWMILISKGGPILAPLASLGIVPPRILGTEAAIVIGTVHFALPFVVLSLASLLRAIPDYLLEAARSLGASPWQRFCQVIWPLSLPGVLSATIISFSLGASAYISPHYLGGPADMTLTTLIAQFVLATYNGQMAATASVILLIVMAAVIFLLTSIVSRRIRG
jgi:ABC-type spermidine/putrescine transport system permease subunit I